MWLPDQYSSIIFIGGGTPSKYSAARQAREERHPDIKTGYGKRGWLTRNQAKNKLHAPWKYDTKKAAADKRKQQVYDGEDKLIRR